MDISKIKGYQCSTCDKIHRRQSDAEKCCPPEVFYVEGYMCGICGTIHLNEEEALACCAPTDNGNCRFCSEPLRSDAQSGAFCGNSACSEFMKTVRR